VSEHFTLIETFSDNKMMVAR